MCEKLPTNKNVDHPCSVRTVGDENLSKEVKNKNEWSVMNEWSEVTELTCSQLINLA